MVRKRSNGKYQVNVVLRKNVKVRVLNTCHICKSLMEKKMKKVLLLMMVCGCALVMQSCQQDQGTAISPGSHPDSSQWASLFADSLSNAIYPDGVWTFEDGVLTASEDQCIWTQKDYDNFILDLEFKTDDGTNSGVVVNSRSRMKLS